MPISRSRSTVTREMRLFSKVIQASRKVPDESLPEFIARRRMPGDHWRTWDEIRFALREVTGEIVGDQTVRGWAKRYGIPEDTEPDGSGGGTNAKAYADILAERGITIS
jgi:hypothetical protein